ncbi:hypothetical protein EN871_14115 [bacterium M00.F.Ca.ET.228.01.1.1]|uniref:hypothetical protein n=1 Tax=Paraburkholderia phenoliruptrix TaxID=252970 RepID=UPI00109285E2|nr:hypothetical protein [Paraburkholderia phenoliruptrix]TGP44152.1 hypothetical protein EN871_14115 [bacterium M00.F.Ca.ET.228.01.1.1]TGS01815.1 hypothetical protein EN834_14110 [bacterium M00.F.Ca.ET.191.01.1.1]TGU08581.1 hypothetical protein EN798_05420 [bacterium M00.F.Ca.ET.155.01.1.1]MBW0450556.1 hypothetical protein [Paraburkholderia phenoliruptrix]MBW9097174.1 hypothetical protein [Paraburkholderia phenoliruptrix]
MQRYGNRSGKSGVVAYEIGDNFVAARFNSGTTYWYSESSVGETHVAALKRLAKRGKGLGTYISQHPEVRDHYERKDPPD